ncbi:MAG: Hsp20/alpha crystallin family protein [Arenicellales bacterium]|jgi:HSP20 family protein|nr:Hsp20/alpha crystallin family protein [Arenicellales bacterium]MDP6672589.1 Hsp20/alpha crystallin family protein [Arenicellales bacterium]MDP7283882.1 Hsp20/alpha crystallin family protein [Arenicellales bacterium]MDP7521572.1 Hsp20/alpha crystallin family protein [Arenicellales bacterium]|tara:strand:- start:710 stop:1156 length:447 start_codon:yes stop_codon:yes gene_type:complete
MNNLTKIRQFGWEPFPGFDRLFSDYANPASESETEGRNCLIPAIDIIEKEAHYLLKAELPGVKKGDLDITIKDGLLTINAERRLEEVEKEGQRVIRQERRFGKFVRSLRLGDDIDDQSVLAHFEDGVLNLELPKAEESKPRKIEVTIN